MHAKFVKCWVMAGAVWAAVCSFGDRLQAMQAESDSQEQEFAFVIGSDSDDAKDREKQSEAPKFWLGIQLKPVEGDLAKYLDSTDGVLVDSVYPDSPASVAGLLKGDIIVAVGDEKLTDPKSLLAKMLAVKADENGKVPALKLKVLRKGESKAIELTPVARPHEELKIARSSDDAKGVLDLTFDLHAKSPEEIEKMIEKLHGADADIRILRFGTPAKVPSDLKGTTRMEIHKSIDGKKVEISINREGDGPAKIKVVRDGETKEYTSDKMDDMPEDIRKMVTDMLENKGHRTAMESKGDGAKDAKSAESDKQVKDRIAEIRDRIALIAPNGIHIDLKDVMDKDTAEKIRTMAKEIEARAHQASKWAHSAAAMPEEIKELKSQVEALRAEIKELREQLKSTAKQTSDK